MFEENSTNQQYQNSHNSGTHQSHEERLERIKKSKNIRKEKIKEKRNQKFEIEQLSRTQLTKEQKREIQKQKNRVAAQLSRDRHKLYVDELENKIKQMSLQLQSKLCRKCKATLTDTSSTEQEEIHDQISLFNSIHQQNLELNLLNEQPHLDELPLVRDNSRNDIQWGNIGRYFCLILFCLAVVLVSSSVQTTYKGVISSADKQVSRILTSNQLCNKPTSQVQSMEKTNLLSTLDGRNTFALQFKSGTGQPIEQCKNNFWLNYLQNVRQNVSKLYDWNLISCTNPNLHHISTVYGDGIDPLQGKWTFLITNPTVSHSHIENDGNHYIDEVTYLTGVYQMIAQKVELKKVIGKDCLA